METAESRALHSDVKLNNAGVMFLFISPVIALTVSVMVPGKVRIFWETVWICWEFWPQSPLLSALHRGGNRHRSVRLGCYERAFADAAIARLNPLRPILVKVQLGTAL